MSAYIPVLSLLLVSSGACVTFAAGSLLRSKRRKLSRGMAALFACMAIYSSGYALELGARDIGELLAALRYEYVGIALIPASWLFVVFGFYPSRKPRVPNAVFLVIPAITIALVMTVDLHSLYYVEPAMTRIAGLSILSFGRGPWYYVQIAYLYASIAFGMVAFLRAAKVGPRSGRTQASLMLAGASLPMLGSIAYLLGLVPYGMDPAPFSLILASPLFAVAFLRYGLLDLAPLARSAVFEQMRDATIVLDDESRVVDFNMATLGVVPALNGADTGNSRGLKEVFSEAPELLKAISGLRDAKAIPIRGATGLRCYDLARSNLLDSRENRRGSVLTLIDVTEREALTRKLVDIANTDELSGLANRRRFFELARIEHDRALRYQRPFAMAILDIDDFKSINDRYGHALGDRALKLCAELCLGCLRSCDLAARYGGDEFSFVLPETDDEGAQVTAGKLRQVVCSASLTMDDGQVVSLRASVGAAGTMTASMEDLETLLDLADRRMYVDKLGKRKRDV